jgi:hypothetical protein
MLLGLRRITGYRFFSIPGASSYLFFRIYALLRLCPAAKLMIDLAELTFFIDVIIGALFLTGTFITACMYRYRGCSK